MLLLGRLLLPPGPGFRVQTSWQQPTAARGGAHVLTPGIKLGRREVLLQAKKTATGVLLLLLLLQLYTCTCAACGLGYSMMKTNTHAQHPKYACLSCWTTAYLPALARTHSRLDCFVGFSNRQHAHTLLTT